MASWSFGANRAGAEQAASSPGESSFTKSLRPSRGWCKRRLSIAAVRRLSSGRVEPEVGENEMNAAVNFGLQLRKERDREQQGVSPADGVPVADTRALAKEINQIKATDAMMWEEVKEIKADMREMSMLVQMKWGANTSLPSIPTKGMRAAGSRAGEVLVESTDAMLDGNVHIWG